MLPHHERTFRSNIKYPLKTWRSPSSTYPHYFFFNATTSALTLTLVTLPTAFSFAFMSDIFRVRSRICAIPSPSPAFLGSLSPFHRAPPAFTFPVLRALTLTVYVAALSESSKHKLSPGIKWYFLVNFGCTHGSPQMLARHHRRLSGKGSLTGDTTNIQ